MRNNKPNLQVNGATRRVGVMSVLFALALLSINSSAHQFKHVVGDVSSVCAVCMQLGRDDQAVAGASIVVEQATQFIDPELVRQASITAPFLPAYRSRAPPSI
ncbi:hypothetical protein [Woeseia oceani]|uniref:Uncharacterized protein n=1 Tax=Woeseia oceani TaxID=1548547 RepID=A0A193LHH2_9GAMM|nr:hypothetical protein [Woeseia oceani]ANO51911.1 hypothetical protein BA177_12480 [Woeseia oceani]